MYLSLSTQCRRRVAAPRLRRRVACQGAACTCECPDCVVVRQQAPVTPSAPQAVSVLCFFPVCGCRSGHSTEMKSGGRFRLIHCMSCTCGIGHGPRMSHFCVINVFYALLPTILPITVTVDLRPMRQRMVAVVCCITLAVVMHAKYSLAQ